MQQQPTDRADRSGFARLAGATDTHVRCDSLEPIDLRRKHHSFVKDESPVIMHASGTVGVK